MKHLSNALFLCAILLSDVMCAHIAYLYRGMLCGIAHMGYSAPASVAFFYAIPYLVGIAACIVVGVILRRKAKH